MVSLCEASDQLAVSLEKLITAVKINKGRRIQSESEGGTMKSLKDDKRWVLHMCLMSEPKNVEKNIRNQECHSGLMSMISVKNAVSVGVETTISLSVCRRCARLRKPMIRVNECRQTTN